MRRVVFAPMMALAIVIPESSHAQDVVQQQLQAMVEIMAGEGYTTVGEPYTGFVGEDETSTFEVRLEGGVAYQLNGVCDQDCTDIDLVLEDMSGTELGADRLEDDVPIIQYTPRSTGTYRVTVSMFACSIEPCGWGVALYRQGGARPAAAGSGSRISGSLAAGDAMLPDKSYYDDYTFTAQAGQTVIVDMWSDAFDTYLILVSPSGETFTNDDHEGDITHSRIEQVADAGGTWTLRATSLSGGQTGAYEVAHAVRGGAAAGTRRSGTLAAGDSTLPDKSHYDDYTFTARAGQMVVVDMRSDDFDTYLILLSPSGETFSNDDYQGDTSHSRIEQVADADGTWTVRATSYAGGATGAYEVEYGAAGGGGAVAAGSGVRTESGRLARGDDTLDSGEYIDVYPVQVAAGERLVVDLRSQEFDTYLGVMTPSGEVLQNDDFEGSTSRSVIRIDAAEAGQHLVTVTSYAAGEEGAYTLRIEQSGGGAVATGPRIERGELAAGDQTLRSGEYADIYTFQGSPGQHVTVDLTSDVFDTYVILRGPAEDREENDDTDRPGHSMVEMNLTESGDYAVIVTSYAVGETGPYTLRIEQGGATAAGTSDVTRLEPGRTVTGRLEPGDGQLEGNEYRDLYAFDGSAGQTISLEMSSSDIDTYLAIITPSGEDVQNDDWEGSTDVSRIEMTLREAGRYRVVATSYSAEETGTYTLTLGSGGAPAVAAGPARSGAGAVYGVFVGISDYPGEGSDLAYTADDARRVAAAMVQGTGMRDGDYVILTDARATRSNVERAVREYGGRAGPDDLFVLFYSGHGGRVDRSDVQMTDPDGRDETLVFYDAQMSDDEMNELFSSIDPGTLLLLLDACFSGGFSKDVISRPGRMGMFSSEEDVTSSVAAKFRAGGYLAHFLADAIGERLADEDGDGQLTAIEVSQYVHERYRADVKSGGPDDYVRTGGPQLGYQHLVVDRGSIRPSQVLFR